MAQTTFQPVSRFSLPESDLTILQPAVAKRPFTVAGERGALFGQQDGTFELWSFPVKMLGQFRITAELSTYPIPIHLNDEATTIAVSPDHTTITYSHAAIVVKQHMFAARQNADSMAGAIVLFEIASTRRALITFQFEPLSLRNGQRQNFGRPSASWVKIAEGGGYVLTTADPQLFGMLAMPRTSSGILPPYGKNPKPIRWNSNCNSTPARTMAFFLSPACRRFPRQRVLCARHGRSSSRTASWR